MQEKSRVWVTDVSFVKPPPPKPPPPLHEMEEPARRAPALSAPLTLVLTCSARAQHDDVSAAS